MSDTEKKKLQENALKQSVAENQQVPSESLATKIEANEPDKKSNVSSYNSKLNVKIILLVLSNFSNISIWFKNILKIILFVG